MESNAPRTIWKYPLQLLTLGEVAIPATAWFLKAGMQDGQPEMWCLVDPASAVKTLKYAVVGTGQGTPDAARFLETFFDGPYVWHLFAQFEDDSPLRKAP